MCKKLLLCQHQGRVSGNILELVLNSMCEKGENYMGRIDAGEERDPEFAILRCIWILILYY